MRPCLKTESGAVAVEFALLLPLFLALVFLITDFGRFFNYLNDANQVASYGARLAAVDGYPGASTLRSQTDTAELRNVSGGNHLPGGMSFCVKYGTKAVGQPVTVKAVGTFKPFSLIKFAPGLKDLTVPIHAEATMRMERLPSFASDCAS